ncbi:hypothetical protein [Azospirillum griseum]|uniref:Uncharacterized protein n=1 Tax=Azospirillum griseum TaxID=2496639 RepID=A0A3S0KV20_9PROT|nr:hypothetical protein [Azospirillum griseum]RTR15661.1 hypothetical protein EJ903_22505 [Azospirillum griseum]
MYSLFVPKCRSAVKFGRPIPCSDIVNERGGNLLIVQGVGQAPSLGGGILVKRWATGPNKGQPKPGTVIQGMLDRGAMELRDDGGHWLRAKFTEAGFAAQRLMAKDARILPPGDWKNLIAEIRTA